MQVAGKAAGGNVAGRCKKSLLRDANGKQNTVHFTESGRNDPLLRGFEDELCVFRLHHGETVELAGDIELQTTSELCRNQTIKLGDKAYGIQSRFELTPEMLAVWAAENPSLTPLGKAKLLADFNEIKEEYVMRRNVAA